MKDIARRAYLLDFYGALLTEKQREIYEWYYQQDLSLGEISEVAGVSRQAIFDLLRRTDEKLEYYEKALGLIAAASAREEGLRAKQASFDTWLTEYGLCLDAQAKEELIRLIEGIVWHLKT